MTALYYMTIKMVKNEECYIVKGYFKSFKENFKQATIIWLIALVVGIIFAGDFMILRNSTVSFGKVIMVLITIVAVIYLFTMIYIFPVLSRFENTVKNTIRNSFLMSVLNLPKTILLIIINLIPTVLLLVTLQAMPLLILFGFSVPAYVASMLFVKIFKRFEPEEEEETSDELETLSFIREEEGKKRSRRPSEKTRRRSRIYRQEKMRRMHLPPRQKKLQNCRTMNNNSIRNENDFWGNWKL